ncbi:hypothetical protein H1R20_g12179, partial [Candolleomyces eurysporus]
MAPSVPELTATQLGSEAPVSLEELKKATKGLVPGWGARGASYPEYLPHFDETEHVPQPVAFDNTDPGIHADPAKANLVNENTQLKHLSPYIGTEISGVQISQLSKDGLNELALYAAERKLLVFRDQDFKDIGPEKQIKIVRHFGPSVIHPSLGNLKGHPEFHIIYRDPEIASFTEFYPKNHINGTSWHSDVSADINPPGVTFFWILDQPELGGDTLFASQVEAYNRLSDEFKKRLVGLRALHRARGYDEIGDDQEEGRLKGRIPHYRRQFGVSEHPVVRVHPVTGEKALFVNPVFTRKIVGFKQEESDFLLNFLFDHLAKGADFQVRASYKPGTVVVWDNRLVAHSGIPDIADNVRRHTARLIPHAEMPVPATSP